MGASADAALLVALGKGSRSPVSASENWDLAEQLYQRAEAGDEAAWVTLGTLLEHQCGAFNVDVLDSFVPSVEQRAGCKSRVEERHGFGFPHVIARHPNGTITETITDTNKVTLAIEVTDGGGRAPAVPLVLEVSLALADSRRVITSDDFPDRSTKRRTERACFKLKGKFVNVITELLPAGCAQARIDCGNVLFHSNMMPGHPKLCLIIRVLHGSMQVGSGVTRAVYSTAKRRCKRERGGSMESAVTSIDEVHSLISTAIDRLRLLTPCSPALAEEIENLVSAKEEATTVHAAAHLLRRIRTFIEQLTGDIVVERTGISANMCTVAEEPQSSGAGAEAEAIVEILSPVDHPLRDRARELLKMNGTCSSLLRQFYLDLASHINAQQPPPPIVSAHMASPIPSALMKAARLAGTRAGHGNRSEQTGSEIDAVGPFSVVGSKSSASWLADVYRRLHYLTDEQLASDAFLRTTLHALAFGNRNREWESDGR